MRDAAVKKLSEGYVLSGRLLVETMTPVPGDPPRIPFTYWAQRKDRLFLTLECPNAEDPKVHLTDDGVLTFSANAKSDSTEADHHYELKLELLHPINAKDSQIHVGPRRTTMVIAKTEEVSGRRDVSSPFFSVSVFRFFSRVPPAKSRQVTSSAHLCADSRAHRPQFPRLETNAFAATAFAPNREERRSALAASVALEGKKPARQNRFRQVGG